MPDLTAALDLANVPGPHRGQPVFAQGAPLEQARGVFIMAHGRGATAPSLLSLGAEIPLPELAFVAPQAAGYTWYPYSFLEPLERNQPHLDSALAVLDSLVQQVEKLGKDPRQIFLLGFSQGACLVLEYTRRYPRRYGGVFGLSGGLIGPPGTRFEGDGSLAGTPIFLGCSDHDPHIPASRVRESSQALQAMGAQVTEKLYGDLGHAVNADELYHINQITRQALQ